MIELALSLCTSLVISTSVQPPAMVSRAPGWSGEFVEQIAAPRDRVWAALLVTLEQTGVKARRIDRQSFSLRTHPVVTRDEKRMKLCSAERLTSMGTWNRKLAVWEGLRHEFDVTLAAAGGSTTAVLRSKVNRWESNTTKRWHPHASTGYLEQEFLAALRQNVDRVERDPNTQGPMLISLLTPSLVRSCTSQATFDKPRVTVWNALVRVLRDQGLDAVTEEEELGLVVTDAIYVDQIVAHAIATDEQLNKDEGRGGWSDEYRATLSCRLLPSAVDPLAVDLACASLIERRSDVRWHAIRSRGYLEDRIVTSVGRALENVGTLDSSPIGIPHASQERQRELGTDFFSAWQATLGALPESGFELADTSYRLGVMTLVTRPKALGKNQFDTLQMSLRPLSADRTIVTVVTSRRRSDRVIGSVYLRAPADQEDRFLERLQRAIDRSATAESQTGAVANRPASDVASTLPRLSAMLTGAGAVGATPPIEVDAGGLAVESTEHGMVLSVAAVAVEPFVVDGPVDPRHVALLVAERVFHQWAFAIGRLMLSRSGLAGVRMKLAFRCYTLDDQTAIDRRVREIEATFELPDLLEFAWLERDAEGALSRAVVLLDGAPVDMLPKGP